MSGGPLSYEPFFGLKKKPFSLASDPEFLYESPSHSAALLTLLAGIRRREGLLAFTGDVGTGKTTICRAVLRSLDRTTFSAFIPDPFASREDLLRMLLIEFGIASVQDITTGPLAQAGRAQLSYLLSSFLDTLVPLEAFVVVFIDEAQNMSMSLLEEVRVLADAFHRHGQLQVVLVGQLELLEKLKSPTMRQVDQRVSVYTRLDPLSSQDVIGYVHHRLQVAGASPNRPLFAPGALHLLHEVSGGIPRIINRVCDRTLHLAYERRSPLIDREFVLQALELASEPAGVDARTMPVPAGGEEITAMLATTATATGSVTAVRSGPPAAFVTKVDAWLSHVDHAVAVSDNPALVQDASRGHEPPGIAPAPAAPPPAAAERPRLLDLSLRLRPPERYIDKLALRWMRMAAVGLLAFVAFNAFIAAASYVPARLVSTLSTDDLPPLPPPPPERSATVTLPQPSALDGADASAPSGAANAPDAQAQYSVSVGAYSSPTRAARVAQALADIGFQVFTRPLPLRGKLLHQVLLGPFDAPTAADEELQRLRAAGDYGDAQVMPLRAASN